MEWLITTFFIGAFLFLLWMGYCNSRTGDQRREMINYMFSRSDWYERRQIYSSVPYDRHMWALICLRDPKMLYPGFYDV